MRQFQIRTQLETAFNGVETYYGGTYSIQEGTSVRQYYFHGHSNEAGNDPCSQIIDALYLRHNVLMQENEEMVKIVQEILNDYRDVRLFVDDLDIVTMIEPLYPQMYDFEDECPF